MHFDEYTVVSARSQRSQRAGGGGEEGRDGRADEGSEGLTDGGIDGGGPEDSTSMTPPLAIGSSCGAPMHCWMTSRTCPRLQLSDVSACGARRGDNFGGGHPFPSWPTESTAPG
eukprot:7074716-Prymnesium_polylepis.2